MRNEKCETRNCIRKGNSEFGIRNSKLYPYFVGTDVPGGPFLRRLIRDFGHRPKSHLPPPGKAKLSSRAVESSPEDAEPNEWIREIRQGELRQSLRELSLSRSLSRLRLWQGNTVGAIHESPEGTPHPTEFADGEAPVPLTLKGEG